MTLEEIKDEYAINLAGYNTWEELLNDIPHHEIEKHTDEVAKLFAKEVAKEALKNASENVRLIAKEYDCDCGNTHLDWNIDKQSILNESNIPEL